MTRFPTALVFPLIGLLLPACTSDSDSDDSEPLVIGTVTPHTTNPFSQTVEGVTSSSSLSGVSMAEATSLCTEAQSYLRTETRAFSRVNSSCTKSALQSTSSKSACEADRQECVSVSDSQNAALDCNGGTYFDFSSCEGGISVATLEACVTAIARDANDKLNVAADVLTCSLAGDADLKAQALAMVDLTQAEPSDLTECATLETACPAMFEP